MIRRILFSLAGILVCSLALAGCAREEESSPGLASVVRENSLLRDAARAVIVGRAHDRLAIAVRNNDQETLQAAVSDLKTLDPVFASRVQSRQNLAAAERLVFDATQLDVSAGLLKDANKAKNLQQQAALKYRAALKLAPNFESRNANLLNSLGYFLADRGSSSADFKIAERLTRRSLQLMDNEMSSWRAIPFLGETITAQSRFERAHGPQDSLAWALFRQNRFEEARREQVVAIAEAESLASRVGSRVAADLYFHLGAIERGLKNFDAARAQFTRALQVEPDHAPSRAALESLSKTAPPAEAPVEESPAEEAPIEKAAPFEMERRA